MTYGLTTNEILSYYGGAGNVSVDDLIQEIADIVNNVNPVSTARADMIAWAECHNKEETA